MRLTDSRIYLALVYFVHALVVVFITLSEVSSTVKIFLLLVCLGNFMWCDKVRRRQSAVSEVRLGSEELVLLIGDQEYTIEFVEKSLSSPVLVVLYFSKADQRRLNGLNHLALFRDGLQGSDWRKLRVFLQVTSFKRVEQRQ